MLHGARFLHAPTALSNRPSQAHVGDQPLLLPGGLPSLAAPPLPSVLPSPCWAPRCVRVSCLFVRHAPLPACAFGCVCFPFAYPGCCLVSSGGLFCSLGDWAGAGGREVWGRCGCRRCARRLQVGRRDTEAARCALGRQGGRGCLVLLLLLFLPLFFCFCLWVLPCCFLCLVFCLLLVSAFALCLLVSAFCAWCSPSHRRVGEGFLSLSLLLLFCAPRVLSIRVWARARPKQSAVRVFGEGPRAC